MKHIHSRHDNSANVGGDRINMPRTGWQTAFEQNCPFEIGRILYAIHMSDKLFHEISYFVGSSFIFHLSSFIALVFICLVFETLKQNQAQQKCIDTGGCEKTTILFEFQFARKKRIEIVFGSRQVGVNKGLVVPFIFRDDVLQTHGRTFFPHNAGINSLDPSDFAMHPKRWSIRS
jgi:hypothetical protein